MFYPEVYSSFLSAKVTLPALQRSYPQWHKGREHYYVWCIEIDNIEVLDRFAKERQKISNFIVQPYERQAHITIAAVGFLSDQPRENDDISLTAIEEQIARIEKLRLLPFNLEIGGLNSFQSAIFLEVHDAALQLSSIRESILGANVDFRNSAYVPHITLGIYKDAFDVLQINHFFLGEFMPLIISVSDIRLYRYDANDIGSPLQVVHKIAFTYTG